MQLHSTNTSVKSFVLRTGRYTSAQKRSYNDFSGKFTIPFENTFINFNKIFNNENPVIAEIGFGMGRATAEIAEKNPQINYLGIEVFKPGIGRLLWEITRRQLMNIRIIEYDAVEVFNRMIPPCSLDGVHLFFPDPWPKKRHHKRRLVKRPFTNTVTEKLKSSAYLYMVSDWEDYAEWALNELQLTEGLVNVYERFSPQQAWRPCTEFEKKGLEKKHKTSEIYFRRI